MRLLPEDNTCLMVHTAGIVIGLLDLAYVVRPGLSTFIRQASAFQTWPEIWVGLPLVFLALNTLYFFIERSVAGFVAVLFTSVLLVYHHTTFPLVQQLVGSLP
jgi:hypothetical protein